MPVQTAESRLKLLAMIFEARYDEGFRLLDHSGELLVRIRQQNPSWVVAGLHQQALSLVNKQHPPQVTANIGMTKLDVSTTERLTVAEAEKQSAFLGKMSEEIYDITVDVLKLPRTTRAGTRFGFLAPSDSLEEADRFMRKVSASRLLDAVQEKTKSELTDAQFLYVLDDPESGYRQRVTLMSAIVEQKPEDPPFQGLEGDVGSGGVVVDIDSYMRPEEAHLGKVGVFVQEGYLRARSQATALFTWLVNQQK
jgi:hypothetical protein